MSRVLMRFGGVTTAWCCLSLLASAATPATAAGDVIVFEKWLPDEARERWGVSVELWSVRSDGSDLRRLTSGAYDLGASWSPDRTRIAFSRVGQIHVLRLEDLRLVKLATDRTTQFPEWLDNDTLIASSAVGPEEGAQAWRLLSIDLAAGSTSTLDAGDLVGTFKAELSPDRSRLAFQAWEDGHPKLFLAQVDDLAETATAILHEGAYPSVWAPDGDLLMIQRGGVTCEAISPDGKRKKAPVKADECNLAWSPSGEQLVFQVDDSLWIMDANGRNRRPLVKPDDDARLKGLAW